MPRKQTPKKELSSESSSTFSTLAEAEKFLREAGEWNGVVGMNREIILNWANFLYNKLNKK